MVDLSWPLRVLQIFKWGQDSHSQQKLDTHCAWKRQMCFKVPLCASGAQNVGEKALNWGHSTDPGVIELALREVDTKA